ncbi:MAG TPA: glycosyltransferase family 1 protein [Burkholderiales bacterium]|nr:glycosyltransferase family 1 protein [Burkholderiales bacterium]
MLPGRSPLVVGLSSTVLERHGHGTQPDGIGTYTCELETALAAEGVVVRRVGTPQRIGARLVRPRSASLAFPLPLSYLAAAASVLRMPVPLAGAVERGIDIYHATDYLVPRLSRTPVVATIYDAIPLAHPAWANPRLRLVKNWLLRRCAQSADLVIAISEAAVDELVQHYQISRDRIRVVPLGVHARWFEQPSEASILAALARHRLQRGYILHVGTLQPRKNLDALISAYESLPQSIRAARQLVLIGKYGWGAEGLRPRLARLRPQGRVVWLDYVERNELLALYRGAGLFAYPSLAEGFGMPVLEALACGLRVIASDLAALREVAAADTVFVSPRRTDAIADAILRVHESGDDAGGPTRRREHARRFTWSACAGGTLRVYRELIR